jgi:hypothetical protein
MPLTTINIRSSLNDFLGALDLNYHTSILSIPLFNSLYTTAWSKHQKRYFAATFYHLRGHFINFAWYIANFSADEQTKAVILANIHDELGFDKRSSHEMLYERFAIDCNVNIHDEIVNETHYQPFAKDFNKAHLKWLSMHDDEERLAAFSAYERLDNLDYPCLTQMVESLALSPQALVFFKVHIQVKHFDSTTELLLPVWQKNPEKIIEAFNFIYTHQYEMWSNLSQKISALNKIPPT